MWKLQNCSQVDSLLVKIRAIFSAFKNNSLEIYIFLQLFTDVYQLQCNRHLNSNLSSSPSKAENVHGESFYWVLSSRGNMFNFFFLISQLVN